jgi:glycine cleavage system aminomethyltransferase T
VGAPVALALIKTEYAHAGGKVNIDIAETRASGSISHHPVFDPDGKIMRQKPA